MCIYNPSSHAIIIYMFIITLHVLFYTVTILICTCISYVCWLLYSVISLGSYVYQLPPYLVFRSPMVYQLPPYLVFRPPMFTNCPPYLVFRPPMVYQLSPYFPKFMLFYVTWPSIQQGLQIDNILMNCLCAHTQSVLYIWPSIYMYFYWL